MFICVFTDIYFGCKKPLLLRELLGTRARQVPVAFRFSVGIITRIAGSFARVLVGFETSARRGSVVFHQKPSVKTACSSG